MKRATLKQLEKLSAFLVSIDARTYKNVPYRASWAVEFKAARDNYFRVCALLPDGWKKPGLHSNRYWRIFSKRLYEMVEDALYERLRTKVIDAPRHDSKLYSSKDVIKSFTFSDGRTIRLVKKSVPFTSTIDDSLAVDAHRAHVLHNMAFVKTCVQCMSEPQ